jgi:hypothetical protein
MAGRATKILAEPEKARRLGSAGQKMVQSRFSIGTMVNGNFSVYQDVLSNKKARR